VAGITGFFAGTALFFRVDEGFLEGEGGPKAIVSSGSNISGGSMLSPVFAPRLRRVLRGVGGTEFVVLRLDCRLGLRWGAGVKSSSLSSRGRTDVSPRSSSSDASSTTTLRRAAALRDGRSGDSADMSCRGYCSVSGVEKRLVWGRRMSWLDVGCRGWRETRPSTNKHPGEPKTAEEPHADAKPHATHPFNGQKNVVQNRIHSLQ
jgi:hypothetical protein